MFYINKGDLSMSMSTHVVGIKPADEKYKKMEQVYNLCQEMKVPVPSEVYDFFDGESPNGLGVEVNISVIKGNIDCGYSYDIDVTTIPKDVKFIRFINSW
jgi:hypothetical protein